MRFEVLEKQLYGNEETAICAWDFSEVKSEKRWKHKEFQNIGHASARPSPRLPKMIRERPESESPVNP
jgi:hypothetical protein